MVQQPAGSPNPILTKVSPELLTMTDRLRKQGFFPYDYRLLFNRPTDRADAQNRYSKRNHHSKD
jgi:hypothetical protein